MTSISRHHGFDGYWRSRFHHRWRGGRQRWGNECHCGGFSWSWFNGRHFHRWHHHHSWRRSNCRDSFDHHRRSGLWWFWKTDSMNQICFYLMWEQQESFITLSAHYLSSINGNLMLLFHANIGKSFTILKMSRTYRIQTNNFWKVAVRALASFIDTSHSKPEGPPCWQVNNIVITVCHSSGHDQPVGLAWRVKDTMLMLFQNNL